MKLILNLLLIFLLKATQTNTQLDVKNLYVDIVKALAERPEGDPTLLITTVFEKLKPLMAQKEDFHYLRSSVDKLIDLINIVPTGNLETLKSIIYMCEEKLLGSIQSQNQKELQQTFIKAICALYKRGSVNILEELNDQTQKLKSIITDINSAQESYKSIISVFNAEDKNAIGVVQQLLIG